MSAIVTKVPRNRLFVGEDKVLRFTVEHDTGDTPATWEMQFVMRRPSRSCPGRDDPGDGAVVLRKDTGDMTVTVLTATSCRVDVPLVRADTLNLDPDDYFAALWRTDDGNDRPLAILRYLHLTAAPRQAQA